MSPRRKRTAPLLDSYPAEEPRQNELLAQVFALPPKYSAVIHMWLSDMDTAAINRRVYTLKEYEKARITSLADTENYDLALYPTLSLESVPGKLRENVNSPIFRIEELTSEVVQMRIYETTVGGGDLGPRMSFGVLYGDVVVWIQIKGMEAETVLEMLQKINQQLFNVYH